MIMSDDALIAKVGRANVVELCNSLGCGTTFLCVSAQQSELSEECRYAAEELLDVMEGDLNGPDI